MSAELPVQPSIPPNTTLQEDLVTLGQRKVNLIWEYTQAMIALVVVFANMLVGVFTALYSDERRHPVILTSAFFLIIGFYFSRTNHAAIGGIGRKPEQPYEGR